MWYDMQRFSSVALLIIKTKFKQVGLEVCVCVNVIVLLMNECVNGSPEK